MSAPSEALRPDDELAGLLRQWLDQTLGNDELRKLIQQQGTAELAPGQRSAVARLLGALGDAFPGERSGLEPLVRETLESLAYGE
jgi:hypothetical protein